MIKLSNQLQWLVAQTACWKHILNIILHESTEKENKKQNNPEKKKSTVYWICSFSNI